MQGMTALPKASFGPSRHKQTELQGPRTEVKIDGQELLIMKESDIMGVLTGIFSGINPIAPLTIRSAFRGRVKAKTSSSRKSTMSAKEAKGRTTKCCAGAYSST